jgi:predicted nucleic acid-binding protein
VAWASSTQVTLHYISCITVFELERGILSMERKDAAQGAILRAWMDRQILVQFSGRILPVDAAVREAARAGTKARARRLDCGDGDGARDDGGDTEHGGFQAHGC